MMNCLFKYSLDNKLPIDLIYLGSSEEITYRSVIIRKITEEGILAYDLKIQQLRSFKRANILSAAKQRRNRGVNFG
jgi:hypothetical protein